MRNEVIKQTLLRNTRHLVPFLFPFLIAVFVDIKAVATFALSMLVVQIIHRAIFVPVRDPLLELSKDEQGKFDTEAFRKSYGTTIPYVLVATTVAVAILFSLEHFIHVFIQSENLLIPMIIAIIGNGYCAMYETLLIGKQKKSTAYLYVSVVSLATLAIFFIILTQGYYAASVPFILMGIMPVVVSFFFHFVTSSLSVLPLSFSSSLLKVFFSSIHWSIAGGLALLSIKWVDIFFIRYFSTIHEVGVYNLAYQILVLLGMIASQMPFFIIDHLEIKLRKEADQQRYFQIFKQRIIPGWIVSIVIISISVALLKPDIWLIVSVLSIASLPYMMTFMYQPFFKIENSIDNLHQGFILALMVNIVLDFILIASIGALGAAIATLAAFVTSYIFATRRYRDMKCRIEMSTSANLPI